MVNTCSFNGFPVGTAWFPCVDASKTAKPGNITRDGKSAAILVDARGGKKIRRQKRYILLRQERKTARARVKREKTTANRPSSRGVKFFFSNIKLHQTTNHKIKTSDEMHTHVRSVQFYNGRRRSESFSSDLSFRPDVAVTSKPVHIRRRRRA